MAGSPSFTECGDVGDLFHTRNVFRLKINSKVAVFPDVVVVVVVVVNTRFPRKQKVKKNWCNLASMELVTYFLKSFFQIIFSYFFC
jgi:hypothetical protein